MRLHISDKVSLRSFRHADRYDIVVGINDWQVVRWLASVPHPYRIDHADAYLARPEHKSCEIAMADPEAILALAICADDRVVGGMSLVPATRRSGFREVGFWLSRPSWGQRIVPAAMRTVIDKVRQCAPDTSFLASANHDNLRSQRLILSLGFSEVGQDEIFSMPLQRRVTVNCFHLMHRYVS